MLLKDCPVGSVVRCVKVGDYFGQEVQDIFKCWVGVFTVFIHDGKKVVKDNDGDIRYTIEDNDNWQFEKVSEPKPDTPKTIYFKGKPYNLTLVQKRDVIEIDGVEYYMEPV